MTLTYLLKLKVKVTREVFTLGQKDFIYYFTRTKKYQRNICPLMQMVTFASFTVRIIFSNDNK